MFINTYEDTNIHVCVYLSVFVCISWILLTVNILGKFAYFKAPFPATKVITIRQFEDLSL